MRKSHFSEEQILGILKRVEAGQKVAEVCREYGISDATFYRWKAQYGGGSRSASCGGYGIWKTRIGA